MEILMGRDFVLWNLELPCRDIDCAGKVVFVALLPELGRELRLSAPMPKSWPEARAR
jgi:hypothetical protein